MKKQLVLAMALNFWLCQQSEQTKPINCMQLPQSKSMQQQAGTYEEYHTVISKQKKY